MIPKSGSRFSEAIMLQEEAPMRFNQALSDSRAFSDEPKFDPPEHAGDRLKAGHGRIK
jgi:hypothetical protein